MPKAKPLVALIESMPDGLNAPQRQSDQASLRQEVKEALRSVLHDAGASAAAKASAGRTLLEYFDDSESAHSHARRGADMSAAELDAAIARLGD
jgi:hypothetical protein